MIPSAGSPMGLNRPKKKKPKLGSPISSRRQTMQPLTERRYTYHAGGGGGGRSYGGGGGGGGSRTVRAPKPKPPPSLSAWLSRDADYQDQLRAYSRALSDFGADVSRRTGKVNADYSAGVKSMGEQRVKDLQDIMNDFAARGLLKSGLYGQRQADYEKQYQSNLSDLGRNKKSLLDDISTEQTQFKRQQELQKETARKDAARRRAEKYGL